MALPRPSGEGWGEGSIRKIHLILPVGTNRYGSTWGGCMLGVPTRCAMRGAGGYVFGI